MLQVSAFQRELFSLLRRLGYQAALEVNMYGVSIDVFLPDHNVAIEADGRGHFCRNKEDRMIGNCRWKKKVLAAKGIRLANISQLWWDHAHEEERAQFLRDAIESRT